MVGFIGMIITGAIIGALARLFILGAVGAFVGGGVAGFFGVESTAGIDWIRWALSIVAAVIAISIYLSITHRK